MNVEIALQLIYSGIAAYKALADVVTKAQNDGRTELTEEELASFRLADDAARRALNEEIARQSAADQR